MRIKYTFFMLLLLGLSNVAMAAALTPPSKPDDFCNLAKPKPVCKQERPILYPGSYVAWHYQRPWFYLGFGVGAYHLNNPTVNIGNFINTNTPIASIDNDDFTPIYNLSLSYPFYSEHNPIFGHYNDIMFKVSYFNKTDNKVSNLTGSGSVWYIDGRGRFEFPKPLFSYTLKAEHQLIDTGLFYRSIALATELSTFTMHPRVGLIFTNYKNKYNYTLHYNAGPYTTNDVETYKVKTNYYGVAGGDQLAFHLASQILLYGDVEVQLLHAVSDLDATQQVDTAAGTPIVSVNENKTKSLTYRAILSIGGKFYFAPRANSVSLDAKIGLDRFGYNPRVVTPSRANSGSRIHLEGTSQNNFFGMLDLNVPFG